MGTEVSLNAQYTLLELAKRTNRGETLRIAEVLNKKNEIIQDAVWIEANQTLSHVDTRRTSLPTGTFRLANQGVATSTSGTRQITERICRLEDLSDIDEAILDLVKDKEGKRQQEDIAHIEGLGQTFVETFFYGNAATNPERVDGLSVREDWDALADEYVYGAGGTGDDTTSLWIIEWGPDAVFCVYPQGSAAGLHFEDKGKQRVEVSTGKFAYMYESQFVQWFGIFVKDPRCVQRIANIETSGSENTLDDNDILEAANQLPTMGGSGDARIYVNRTLRTQFDILAKDKSNVNYTAETAFGVAVTRFRGIPIRMAEQIVNTETAIT